MTEEPTPRELLDRAVAAHRAGRLDEAAALYRAVLTQAPEEPNALTNLGTVALQQGRLDEGVALIEASLKIRPDQSNAINNRANALMTLGRLDEALAGFTRAIELDAGNVEAHANQAGVLRDLGRLSEAQAAYERAIALQPTFLDALNGLANTLEALGQAEAAAGIYDRALELAPQAWELHFNRGNALRATNRPAEAVAAYDRAAALNPASAEVWANRAAPLQALKRLDEAMASCERALALDPDHANANWNKALLLLLAGDEAAGWRQYEWRWRQPSFVGTVPPEGPRWLGETPLDGKRLLIVCEQGFGDTIQMLRYARVAAERADEVLAIVQPPLSELAASVAGIDRVLTGGEPITYDAWIPMMSLPHAFGAPPYGTPYMAAPADKRQAWADRLGPRTRPRVGLVWSGRANHGNDANRSLSLAALAPLLAADADFISLQTEYRDADRAVLAAEPRIRDVSGELASFSDTAGLIEALDLVISVDTSVAHLAGALGRPLLILLPFSPDFRWRAEGPSSAWYPSARLLRQPAFGAWGPVIAQALEAVRDLR
ncbi:tetratricopeptide repeat protein [Phenylobacterium soli]|nr:tetratricopeptide repeat protein [Phenylobacterium soli]